MKRIIACMLCLITAFGAVLSVGCKKNNDEATTQTITEIGGEPVAFADGEEYLVKNGKSDYKIVVGSTASIVENYAAEELSYFIEKSTGVKLPIVTDATVAHDNSAKYISVGETSLLSAQTDIKVDYDELGQNGVTAYTRGNCVYLAGATEYGTLFSVYRFLYYQIGYVAYAYDCVEYNYCQTLKLKNFEYKYTPSLGLTTASDAELTGQDKVKAALRMNIYAAGDGGQDMAGNLYNGLWCHTMPYLVSQTYNPELWRNEQLCYSNPLSAELAAETLITKYVDAATGPYLMLGVTDGKGSCDCDNCVAQEALYGGAGGVQMRFMNDVATRVENYMKENGITKRLVLVAFAYYAYRKPPVVMKNGEYKAVDPSVIPKTGQVSVGVMFTPIEACYTHPITDDGTTCKSNTEIAEDMKGWAAITNYLMMYSYGTNFSSYKYHFNNWSHEGDSFRFYQRLGLKYYFEQSCSQNGISPMSSMRAFVRSRLGWNCAYDTQDLIDEFITHYYGDGAEGVRKYFSEVMENFERIYTLADNECQGIYHGIYTDDYWTRPLMKSLESYLEEADYLVDLGTSANKEVYKERIFREYFLMKDTEYMKYANYLNATELAELEKLVNYGREKYNAWRSAEAT